MVQPFCLIEVGYPSGRRMKKHCTEEKQVRFKTWQFWLCYQSVVKSCQSCSPCTAMRNKVTRRLQCSKVIGHLSFETRATYAVTWPMSYSCHYVSPWKHSTLLLRNEVLNKFQHSPQDTHCPTKFGQWQKCRNARRGCVNNRYCCVPHWI